MWQNTGFSKNTTLQPTFPPQKSCMKARITGNACVKMAVRREEAYVNIVELEDGAKLGYIS